MKLLFAVLSSLFLFIGFYPYIKDIYCKKTKPQFFSWLGWGILTLVGGLASVSEIATWGSAILFSNSFVCLFIAFYALSKRVAVLKASKYDYIFIIAGLVGIFLWKITGDPDLAIVFAVVADLSFGILTIIKTYKDPSSETKILWLLAVVSGFFGILAVSFISFTETAYPVYLFFYDFIMFLVVYRLIKKKNN